MKIEQKQNNKLMSWRAYKTIIYIDIASHKGIRKNIVVYRGVQGCTGVYRDIQVYRFSC